MTNEEVTAAVRMWTLRAALYIDAPCTCPYCHAILTPELRGRHLLTCNKGPGSGIMVGRHNTIAEHIKWAWKAAGAKEVVVRREGSLDAYYSGTRKRSDVTVERTAFRNVEIDVRVKGVPGDVSWRPSSGMLNEFRGFEATSAFVQALYYLHNKKFAHSEGFVVPAMPPLISAAPDVPLLPTNPAPTHTECRAITGMMKKVHATLAGRGGMLNAFTEKKSKMKNLGYTEEANVPYIVSANGLEHPQAEKAYPPMNEKVWAPEKELPAYLRAQRAQIRGLLRQRIITTLITHTLLLYKSHRDQHRHNTSGSSTA